MFPFIFHKTHTYLQATNAECDGLEAGTMETLNINTSYESFMKNACNSITLIIALSPRFIHQNVIIIK